MEQRIVRQRIKTMKEIKEKHNLTLSMIADIVESHGGYVSERTIAKAFGPGSEHKKYQFQSIANLYEALIEEYGETHEAKDPAVLAHIITERNTLIDSLIVQIEDLNEDFERRLVFYKERKDIYENTIALLKEQIDRLNEMIRIREDAIRRKDEIMEKLLDEAILKRGKAD